MNIVEINNDQLPYDTIPSPVKAKVEEFISFCKTQKKSKKMTKYTYYDSFFTRHYAGCVVVFGGVDYEGDDILRIFTYTT